MYLMKQKTSDFISYVKERCLQTWQGPSDEHSDDEAQQESASASQQQSGSAGSLQQTERAQNQRDLNHKVTSTHLVFILFRV